MKNIKIVYTLFIVVAVFLFSCENVLFEEEPANDPVGNFESLWHTFDERYAVFGQRGVDWNELYDTYRPQITNSTTNDQLFDIITSMLSHLNDGHVSLMAAGKPFWAGYREFRERTRFELFDFEVVRRYMDAPMREINNQYAYGKINGEIGYLFIAHLSGSEPAFVDDFIQENQNSKGIILDLRHNGGGDFTNGEIIASRFATERTLAFSATPKDGPNPDDYGETIDYFIAPSGAVQFTKPIVVLTNCYTISAGESTVLYLRVLPNVTVIGENTTGAMGERIEKEIPNGWIYSISGQIITAADGNSYEGPGIPPDIYSENTEQELRTGTDTMLERAIAELN